MAEIYLAKTSGRGSFERYVVVKMILAERADDERFVSMFLDEARVAATLNHQNIAQVYDVDDDNGTLYLTMEYVHGENLRAVLEHSVRKSVPMPLELAVYMVSCAAQGLHHAHERTGKNGQPLNIVHRDVTPANIMVGFDGSVKVLDFGIAKADERSTKTQQGTIKGKYGYMSPEQCRGRTIDRRTDIFALGIILYEVTTLRRAYRGTDDFDTMRRIVNGEITLPSKIVPGYPPALEAIVAKAMAIDPDQRFQTSAELADALDRFSRESRFQATPAAVGRQMVALFGARPEPWVAAAAAGASAGPRKSSSVNEERTQVATAAVLDAAASIMETSRMPVPRDGGAEGSNPHATPESPSLDGGRKRPEATSKMLTNPDAAPLPQAGAARLSSTPPPPPAKAVTPLRGVRVHASEADQGSTLTTQAPPAVPDVNKPLVPTSDKTSRVSPLPVDGKMPLPWGVIVGSLLLGATLVFVAMKLLGL